MHRFSQSWVLVLFIALPALFLWRVWALNPADRQVFVDGDFVEQFYPLRRFAAEELKAGRLPLWNPHIYAGTPALADPQWAALYPPTWLSALLPPWPPFPFEILQAEAALHLGLAGLFTYLFARRHVPQPAALLAGLVYAYGGYLTSYPPLQLAVLETATWLPLCLWGAEIVATMDDGRRMADDGRRTTEGGPAKASTRISTSRSAHHPSPIFNLQSLVFSLLSQTAEQANRSRGFSRFALPLLSLVLSFLAGHPQTFLYIAYTTVAYYLVCAWGRLTPWQTVGRLVVWLLVVVMLTAGQWLPTLELARLGPRLVLPYEQAAVGFSWPDLTHIITPGVTGVWSPLYVGGATLLLAGVAVWRRQGRFWVFLALVGALLSLGANGGLYWLAYHIAPGFNLFRHQERAAILWSFALAMLAGHGLKEIKRLKTKDLRRSEEKIQSDTPIPNPQSLVFSSQSLVFNLQSLVFNLQSFIFYLPAVVVAGVAVGLIALWTVRGQPDGSRLALWSSQGMYSALMLGAAGLCLTRIGQARWRVALVGVVALDLFSTSGRGLLQTPPKDGYLAPNPIVWTIQADPDTPFRVSSEGLLPPGGGNGAVIWRVADVVGNSPLHLAAHDELLRDVPELVWWRLLGVRYVVTQREIQHGALAEIERVGQTRLYRLDGGLPLAWVTPGLRVAVDATTVRQTLAEPGFDPWVYAVTAEPGAATWGLPGAGPPLVEATVQLTRHTPTHITITVDSPRPGVLVHAEAYASGWTATVNHQAAPVIQVYGLLRGTPIPAGPSVVEWRYQPWTVTLGLTISGLTLLLLTALSLTPHLSHIILSLRRQP